MWRGSTNPYRIRACDECSLLVGLVIITVLYRVRDLGRIRPRDTFTNHYHRDRGLGIDLSVGEVVWVM